MRWLAKVVRARRWQGFLTRGRVEARASRDTVLARQHAQRRQTFTQKTQDVWQCQRHAALGRRVIRSSNVQENRRPASLDHRLIVPAQYGNDIVNRVLAP